MSYSRGEITTFVMPHMQNGGRSSMDITVEVFSGRVSTGEREHTHSAHVVFVAVDQNRKPTAVPRLVPETPEEQARFDPARRFRQEHPRR